ncbi:Na+/H+ antiporter subunit E [Microbulbifer yueqingensis]|uniref:Multisubunit sodium/proton antiporter, MrpE subunit n=1 Tax=Microbulbifer yueqingensis TaxID=658219 RepID=A0A1G8ZX82_9GAMM|nr:Na+/H+ antiporter subunit E [Microbulbifer yueqingensis]SDK19663.1 multisubunit sodium/proton antiporter, MrpE subunit [Microbulbifer yueqingensis]
MRYLIALFLILSFIWLANSGHYTALLLGFGFISVLFVIAIARRMGLVDHESQPVGLLPRLPGYYWWLFRKIVQSNLTVVAGVWRGRAGISPTSARIPLRLKTDMGKVLYANSITLTPGTVAVDIENDEILVHSLTSEGLDELRRGEMEKQVRALEE